MRRIFEEVIIVEDEIVEITELDFEETVDIETDGNHLFFANDLLTHNSAVEEIEFDHSHISGGLSKIQTADNVIGIFTSRAMRERGRYQIQLMKTRSSSGVGSKVDLEFDIDTLRITDLGEDAQEETTTGSDIVKTLRRTNSAPAIEEPAPKAEVGSTRLRQFLNTLDNK
jgi:hypothetical protein